MSIHEKLPAVRPLDVTPFQNERGEPYFALRDMSQIAPGALAVSPAGYFVIAHLDGERTVAEIQRAFREQSGQALPAEQVEMLVAALDETLLLHNERFENAYAARRDAYLAAPLRDNRERWPAAEELRAEIERMLARGTPAPVADPRGIIAPHLDYARGSVCYADAYATLAQAEPAERYVILGTNHFGRSTALVATRKDFQTPLGLVPTDREFITRVEQRLGKSICAHEFDHHLEHSVDLQTHILQVCQPQRPFQIVAVLCPDPCGPTGTAPSDGNGPDLGTFADALADLLARADRRTVLIAGADLSHVGQRFGDPDETTPEFLEEVARIDRWLLSLLERRQEQTFVEAVRKAGNPTRICSVGCIYTLLRALPHRPCRLLGYHQAVNMQAEAHVTCAAAVVGS